MFAALYASLDKEQPPSCLMFGYVISGVTASKLTAKVQNIDPDTLRPEPGWDDYFSPPPGIRLMGNHKLIMDSIEKYMIGSGLEPGEVGVEITLTGTDEEINTIIVTQSSLLPHGFDGERPEAEIGKREIYVRQWLEDNGTFLLTSLLACSHVTRRCQQETIHVGVPRGTLQLGLGSPHSVALPCFIQFFNTKVLTIVPPPFYELRLILSLLTLQF